MEECFPESLSSIRIDQDKGQPNKLRRSLFELCKATGLRLLNGRVFNDLEGCFTRIGITECSVVGYVLCEGSTFDHIYDFKVNCKLRQSNHCPILLELHNNFGKLFVNNSTPFKTSSKYNCNSDNMSKLREAFENNLNCEKLQHLYNSMIISDDVNKVS